MNAGIADAANLSWLLAAHLQRLGAAGDPRCLRGRAPADHRAGLALRDGPRASDDRAQRRARAGRDRGRRRRRATRRAPRSGRRPMTSTCSSTAAPASTSATSTTTRRSSPMTAPSSRAYTMADFTPSSTPGCRAPFAKLADGRPVYDALGPGYTLLRFDPDVAVAPLADAMRAMACPLRGRRCPAGEGAAARRPQAASSRAPISTWPGAATPSLTIPHISSAKLLGRSLTRAESMSPYDGERSSIA